MGTGDDLRVRMWRERLVRALVSHLPAEVDEAESIAELVIVKGLPPGMDEVGVQSMLRSAAGATPDWVERVMAVVRAVRDGLRLAEPEVEVEPEVERMPVAEEQPVQVGAGLTGPVPLRPPGRPSTATHPDPEILLSLVLERLRAIQEANRLAPQVEGARHNLRTLRMTVAGESDESTRLPLLLAEWLATRQRWEAQNRVYHGALATLRASEWLLQYLQAPQIQEE